MALLRQRRDRPGLTLGPVSRSIAFPAPPLSDGVVSLRPWVRSDVRDLARICRDPEIPRFTKVPRDYTPEIGAYFVAGSTDRARAGEALELAVCDAGDGTLLGSVALHRPSWETGDAEIGYWTAREARGRGVATRAVRLLSAHALGTLGLARVEIAAFAENEPSQAVARAAGFTEVGLRERHVEHQGALRDCVVFEMRKGGP
jgi:RimJ/RimL family protein N-acetyltransferase